MVCPHTTLYLTPHYTCLLTELYLIPHYLTALYLIPHYLTRLCTSHLTVHIIKNLGKIQRQILCCHVSLLRQFMDSPPLLRQFMDSPPLLRQFMDNPLY